MGEAQGSLREKCFDTRHSGPDPESREGSRGRWIPAFAGMTTPRLLKERDLP
jgi:hypothetical protein